MIDNRMTKEELIKAIKEKELEQKALEEKYPHGLYYCYGWAYIVRDINDMMCLLKRKEKEM